MGLEPAQDAPSVPDEPAVVEMAVQPISRLWVVMSIAVGAGILLAATVLVLGEILIALRQPILEALILARTP